MKKIFISILGILIGFVGFSSAEDSCYNRVGDGFTIRNSYSASNWYARFSFNTGLEYTINSFSLFDTNLGVFASGRNFISYYCLLTNSDFSTLSCYSVPAYSWDISNFDSGNLHSFTFSNSIIIDGSVYSDIIFLFNTVSPSPGTTRVSCFNNTYEFGTFTYGNLLTLSNSKNQFTYGSNTYQYLLNITDVCYSVKAFSNNKLNILDDNGNNIKSIDVENGGTVELFINSPVIQNSNNVYIYDGVTGINLFYNDSSVFYTKSNLYLNGSYGYNNNVFTPYCL